MRAPWLLLLLLVAIPVVAAKERPAGVTPDSFLWSLDVALDRLSLALTRNPEILATRGLEIANERLMEIQAMLDQGNPKGAQRASAAYQRGMTQLEHSLSGLNQTELGDDFASQADEHDAIADLLEGRAPSLRLGRRFHNERAGKGHGSQSRDEPDDETSGEPNESASPEDTPGRGREDMPRNEERGSGAASSGGLGGGGGNADDCAGKVLICHVNPAVRNTLCVDNHSLPAHLAHGDTMGACQSCSPGRVGNLLCSDGDVYEDYRLENCTILRQPVEECPDGCSAGECVATCDEGFYGERFCDNDTVVQRYRLEDCDNETRDVEECDAGCENGTCVAAGTPLSLKAVVYYTFNSSHAGKDRMGRADVSLNRGSPTFGPDAYGTTDASAVFEGELWYLNDDVASTAAYPLLPVNLEPRTLWVAIKLNTSAIDDYWGGWGEGQNGASLCDPFLFNYHLPLGVRMGEMGDDYCGSVGVVNGYYTSTPAAVSSDWRCYAGTYNGSHLCLYVNGVLDGCDLKVLETGNEYLFVGDHMYGGSPSHGSLARFAIFDEVLTPNEQNFLCQDPDTGTYGDIFKPR